MACRHSVQGFDQASAAQASTCQITAAEVSAHQTSASERPAHQASANQASAHMNCLVVVLRHSRTPEADLCAEQRSGDVAYAMFRFSYPMESLRIPSP